MTMRVNPILMDAVIKGGLNEKQLKAIGFSTHEILHLIGDLGFKETDHAELASQYLKGTKGKAHFEVSSMHIGMIKYVLRFVSGETISHFTGLNRMWVSRVRNGQYGGDIQPITCTFKDLINSFPELESTYNGRLFHVDAFLKVLHSLGITAKQAAQELNIAEKYVRRCYFEFENN